MASAGVSSLSELCGRVSGARPAVQVLPRSKVYRREPAETQGAHRIGGRSSRGSPVAKHARIRRRAPGAVAASSGRIGRRGLSVPLHTVWRVHESLSQQRASSCVERGGAGRSLDAGSWCRGLATARAVACCAPRFVRPAQSGRSRRKKRAGRRGSRATPNPSAWEQRSWIADDVCRGRWQPRALCARSGVRHRPRPSICNPPKSPMRRAICSSVKQPFVDPHRCVGCGACEYACPVQDRPAVYVTSVGESRSRTNQILLNRGKDKDKERPR